MALVLPVLVLSAWSSSSWASPWVRRWLCISRIWLRCVEEVQHGQVGPELAVPCFPKALCVVHPLCVTQPSLLALLLVRRTRETLEPRAALSGQFVKPFSNRVCACLSTRGARPCPRSLNKITGGKREPAFPPDSSVWESTGKVWFVVCEKWLRLTAFHRKPVRVII